MRIFTDLRLDGDATARARPRIGEWGPEQVPSTRWKRWQRVLAIVVFVVALIAVVLLGWYFYNALMGGGG